MVCVYCWSLLGFWFSRNQPTIHCSSSGFDLAETNQQYTALAVALSYYNIYVWVLEFEINGYLFKIFRQQHLDGFCCMTVYDEGQLPETIA